MCRGQRYGDYDDYDGGGKKEERVDLISHANSLYVFVSQDDHIYLFFYINLSDDPF